MHQTLLAYTATRPHHVLRRRGLSAGTRSMLKAAGVAGDRAKAVDLMARRLADAWRKAGHEPGPAELDSEVERLLT